MLMALGYNLVNRR